MGSGLLEEQEQANDEAGRAADVERHDLVGGRTCENLANLRFDIAGQPISPERQAKADDHQDDANDLHCGE
jgi:hypothetical protein